MTPKHSTPHILRGDQVLLRDTQHTCSKKRKHLHAENTKTEHFCQRVSIVLFSFIVARCRALRSVLWNYSQNVFFFILSPLSVKLTLYTYTLCFCEHTYKSRTHNTNNFRGWFFTHVLLMVTDFSLFTTFLQMCWNVLFVVLCTLKKNVCICSAGHK